MQTLETLEVYIVAKAFRKEIIKTTSTFLPEEKYLLASIKVMDASINQLT